MISGVEHETFYNFRTINIFIIKRMYLDTDNIILPALATDFSGKGMFSWVSMLYHHFYKGKQRS